MTKEKRTQERNRLFWQEESKWEDLQRLMAMLRDMSLQHFHTQNYGRKLMSGCCDEMKSLLCELDEIDMKLKELRD